MLLLSIRENKLLLHMVAQLELDTKTNTPYGKYVETFLYLDKQEARKLAYDLLLHSEDIVEV